MMITKRLLSLVVVLGSLFTGAFAQQSDYKIVQNFQEEYEALEEALKEVESMSGIENLMNRIDSLKSEYSEHIELINAAIYPDTYSNRINSLETQFNAAESRIREVESLEKKLTGQQKEIDKYTRILDSLRTVVIEMEQRLNESTANVDALNNRVSNLNQVIERRDKLVSDIMSDLLEQYQSLDETTKRELTSRTRQMEGDPVQLIKNIIQGYNAIAESAANVEVSDYLRMKKSYLNFQYIWEKFSEQLTSVYSEQQAQQARKEINELLAEWGNTVDTNIYDALNANFQNSGINVENFETPEGFYKVLTTYIDSAKATALETNKEEELDKYQNFANYWDNITENEGGELLMNAEVLTYSQLASINQKLVEWRQAATPKSNWMNIYLFIALGVVAVLIVVVLLVK